MSTEYSKPTVNELIRRAALRNGRVTPPDTSKGETWDGQMQKALVNLRSKNVTKLTKKDTETTVDDSPANIDNDGLGEQLDPFTMNDLMRKAFGR